MHYQRLEKMGLSNVLLRLTGRFLGSNQSQWPIIF